MPKTFVAIWGMEWKEQHPHFIFQNVFGTIENNFFLYVRLANYLNTIKAPNLLSKIKTTNTIIFTGLILSQKVREELQTIILGLKASSKTSLL